MASSLIKTLLSSLDSEMLEELVLSYVNEKYLPEPSAQRIGVSGQSQDGVDVYAHVGACGYMGFQSKAYTGKTKLTTGLLDKELALCHGFTPRLDFYTVVTLNTRDAKLQTHARAALLHGNQNRVSVIALEDLASIVDSSSILKSQLFNYTLRPSDIQEISDHLGPLSGAISTLPMQESDRSLPEDLRIAEDWVENGMPLRALSALDARQGRGSQPAATLIRCRALYSLDRYSEVVSIAQAEFVALAPHAPILILGALAAEEQGNADLADKLADSALESATSTTRANVIGGCIRLRAKRPGARVSALEAFAEEQLGGGEKVAVALADSAASIGDPSRAAYWFKTARQSRPSLPLGVQINELATALVIASDRSDKNELLRIISRLEQILESVAAPEEPAFRRVIQINLGAAFRALGRTQDAASIWDQVLVSNSGQREIWIHRCLLSEHDNKVQPPGQGLVGMHATDPLAKLAYASALTSVNRLSEATALVTEVLDAAETTAEEASVAKVERLRIRIRIDGRNEAIADALQQVAQGEHSLPLLNWLSMQHSRASQEDRQRINIILQQMDLSMFSDDAVVAMATPIALGSSAVGLGSWISRLEKISFGATGELRNGHAASVLAEIQADTLDFSGCIRTLKSILEWDGKNENIMRLAQAYYQSGDRIAAFEMLQDAIVGPDASALSVRNWAHLAVSLGRRRHAIKFFSNLEKPQLNSPNDYILLMQARLILGIKEDDLDAADLLRSGFVTPERASQVFALGVNRKAHRPVDIAGRGTFVTISIEDELNETFYISEPSSRPMLGIRSLDPTIYPWVEQLIGQKTGAEVRLVGQPFDGKIAKIRSVRGASDFLFAEALRQISLSSTEKTGVQRLNGEPQFLMDEAKKVLTAHHKLVEENIAIAKQGHFPASLMSKLFHTTPRDFLFHSRSWTPQSHSGHATEIQADEAVVDKSNGWIFDATTVLLLAMIDAEDFPNRLLKLPRITKVAVAQLCDWHAHDREQRRATGHMNLNEEGSLYVTGNTAANRVSLLKFWKKVEKIVSQCRIIDVPTVELSNESVQLLDLLDPETFATFHAGKFHKLTLISEEVSVRALASLSTGISASSLTALILEAWRRSWIKIDQAMVLICRLIDLGWTWVGFPTEWLWQCLYLSDADRSRVFHALYGRIQRADPSVAIPAVFVALAALDRTNLPRSDIETYRKAAIDGLPKIDVAIKKKLVRAYTVLPAGDRAGAETIKQLNEWAWKDT